MSNRTMKENVQAFASGRILHYLDENPNKALPKLLDWADLYLTKPRGLSVTEAASKHLPMVLIDAVSGCETYNSTFYRSLGCAAAARNAEDIAALCLALLQNEDEYQRMTAAYAAYPLQNAAKCICDTLKSTAGAH